MWQYPSTLLVLFPLFVCALDSPAKRHFENYLAQCGSDEIRCVWFLNEDQRVGMVMPLDLQKSDVNTVRMVHNGAIVSIPKMKALIGRCWCRS